MRLINIASGSSGNSTYIGNRNTHLLVDSGISRKRILEGLNSADLDLKDLTGILITHEHIDHIGSLGVLLRTVEIPVYATKGTIEGIKACASLGNYNEELLIPIDAETEFCLGDMKIKPLRVSHDAKEPVCYRFEDEENKAAIVTDLGEYTDHLIEELAGLDLLMIESNHDVRMLEVGPYPYPIKQRILGRYGHLSNENAGRFLSSLLHDEIKDVVLAHISKENNTRELAKISVEAEIDLADNKYKAKDFELKVARPDRTTNLVEI